MIRQNQYDITIEFKVSGKNTHLFSGAIPYLGSATLTDSIAISNKKITISCKRSSKINLDDIFYNHNSSLYNQVIKTLVYYYALNFNCPKIKRIYVTRKGTLGILEEKTLEISSIIQPVSNKIESDVVFNSNAIAVIFQEDEKGKTLLIAVSYWLKAMSTTDAVFSFERLWRGLNSIYAFIGSHGNDTACHIALRSFTLANTTAFAKSTTEANIYTAQTFRNLFRWRALILNDYPTQRKTRAYSDFITRYNDERIMHMFNETLPYRLEFLTREHLLTVVNTHITLRLETPIKSNAELVSLLCIKYSYFLRNKSFHGEKIDGTFRLVENKEIRELERINKIQSYYVSDLINSNHLY